MTDYDPWAPLRESSPAQQAATAAPLTTLRSLGLITDEPPAWWRNVDVEHLDSGTAHQVRPTFLSTTDLRHLAALTLEGYVVRVFPRGNQLKLVIKESP